MHVSEVSCHLQVDALPVLTLVQLGELVFSPPARPEDRGNILTRVFDFLLQTSNRDKLNGFIPSLQTQARKVFNATLHITCAEIHLTTTIIITAVIISIISTTSTVIIIIVIICFFI